MDDLLTSAEAAKLMGVGSTAIKRWSDTGALPCVRTAGGHRRFRRQDVERLMRRPETAAHPPSAPSPAASHEWTPWIEILTGSPDVHLVQSRIYELRAREGAWHAAAQRLGLLLEEIGRRWEAGAISVMEEHLASATVQRALAAVVDAMPVSPQAPRCLLAAAEGDEHTLGLSLVDLSLREAGWRSEWAGGRTRSSDIVGRVLRGGLDMVAISAASAHGNRAVLEAEVASVGEACEAQGVTLVLGGSGAWPEPPAYGRRFRSLVPFYAFAQSYLTARERG